jgi:hypothetical protein
VQQTMVDFLTQICRSRMALFRQTVRRETGKVFREAL